MNAAFVLLFIAFVIGLNVLILWWTYVRSDSLIDGWAQRHGLRVLYRERRWFFRGPFFWTSSKGQTVYYITVQDNQGQRRNAWVRCGSWWWGLWSDAIEVRWDS
jgi:hypothetical protein